MRKYWVITQLFYPDETSTGYVMTKIAEALVDLGYVNVVCGSPEYQSKDLNSKATLNENIKLFRIQTPRLNKNKLLNRFLVFIYFTFSVIFKIVFKINKEDTVVLVTNPPSLLFVIGALKKIKKFNLVIILQDVFPENAAASGILNKNSITYQFVLKTMNYGYKKADKLIACGSDMAQHFTNKGIKCNRIYVVPNWADHQLIYPDSTINRNEYFNLNLNNKIVLEFAGNIGRVQGLENFIKIFAKSTNINLVLVIIGDGANKKLLEEFVSENSLKNVYFFKSKPRNEQYNFLNCCDIGLITLCEGMYGLGVPSKVYNIMSAGKPILYIGDDSSEIDNYIKSNNIGWSFNWGNEICILKFLNNINIDNIDYLSETGFQARSFMLENFTEERVLNMYKQLLN